MRTGLEEDGAKLPPSEIHNMQIKLTLCLQVDQMSLWKSEYWTAILQSSLHSVEEDSVMENYITFLNNLCFLYCSHYPKNSLFKVWKASSSSSLVFKFYTIKSRAVVMNSCLFLHKSVKTLKHKIMKQQILQWLMLTSLVSNLIINYTGTVLLCYNSNTVAKLLYYTLSYLTPVCSVMHKIYSSEVSHTQRCSQNLAVQI